MKQPPFLKPGDTIGIIAPSRKIGPDKIEPCIQLFESWGLKVLLGKNVYAEDNQFAGTDNQRRQDFQDMLDKESVKAIICARGGYGTVRMLGNLNLNAFKKNPKWIIGYSDITAIHSFFFTKLACPTIHGIMPVNYDAAEGETISWQKLRSLIFGDLPEYYIDPHPFNNEGQTQGKVVGGNLSVLYSLSGTAYDIDTRGCILFMEDLDEYLYHIDRMMMNLKLSGKLDHLKGMIIGGMSDMKDNTIPFGKDALEIISDYTRKCNFPVIYNFPAGHITPNFPLIFGREASILADKNKAEVKFLP